MCCPDDNHKLLDVITDINDDINDDNPLFKFWYLFKSFNMASKIKLF